LSVTCCSTKTYTITEQLADRRAVTRDQTALSCWAAKVDVDTSDTSTAPHWCPAGLAIKGSQCPAQQHV